VEPLTAYLHPAQVADLRLCYTVALTSPARTPRPIATRPWSLRDRLTERDITELITAYRDGVTAASLAADYALSLKSVRACWQMVTRIVDLVVRVSVLA
jgi:hypothetical protein